jgi:sulfur-oxidizing protein SoxZ
MSRALVQAPKTARLGEVVEVRAVIAHPMETGFRLDTMGKFVQRDLIRRFTCHEAGQLVFEAELHAAVSANPFFAFQVRINAATTLSLRWVGDKGFDRTETVHIALA